MLIKKEHKKIVLRLRDPTKITDVIPTAKLMVYQGATFVVVPHRSVETKLLRNLGFDAPNPVDMYYTWPIREGWQPLPHQKETVRFLTENRRAFCLDDMGCGKTLSALWAFDFLRSEKTAKRLLVVSPLSTLERTWADELTYNFPHLSLSILYGSKERRRLLIQQNTDVCVINHDGTKVITDDLVNAVFDVVIIDEVSQAARNHTTDRWKTLKAITRNTPIVWGMTGTPIPNDPTDAWAQCRLLVPERVPMSFNEFKNQTMKQVTDYKWIPRPESLDVVYQVMQPSIRHKRDDCIDLPPVMYETRQTPLTKAQQTMFDAMMETLYAEYKGQGITAVNEGVKAMKLTQICAGAAYGDDETTVVTPPKHRLIALRDVVEEAASKVIVFVPFRSALETIASILRSGCTVGVIHGGVAKGERDRIFSEFQRTDNPRVLVAQPAAMSHGLTLTAASVIVWWAPITSAETYEQANARITRPGQKHSQLIVHLQGTAIEARMYERLKTKTTMQGVLLDMLKHR